MTIERTSGPTRKARTPNPNKPKGEAMQRLMTMLPTVGTIIVGLGVAGLEALAQIGVLTQWAKLHKGIKAGIFTLVGGFASYQASEAIAVFRRNPRNTDAEVDMCRWLEAKGALFSKAIELGGLAAFEAVYGLFFAPAGDPAIDTTKTSGGLDPAMLEALLGDDAQMALDEIARKQDVIERERARREPMGELVFGDEHAPVGELNFDLTKF